MCVQFNLYYWPILTVIWFLLTFITSYLVSTFNGHVSFIFPYISDTGTKVPDSCIFGQMLNIGAFLMLITMYIRYEVVQLCRHQIDTKIYKTINLWSNLFGGLSCLGMSLVANFQETSVIVVHFIGAFLAFGVGAVYCIIHAYLTWLTDADKFVKYSRIILSGLVIPLYIATTVCSTLAFDQFTGKNQFKWSYDDDGYTLHLTGTFCEWVMALVMIFYIGSFFIELKSVKFVGISFELK